MCSGDKVWVQSSANDRALVNQLRKDGPGGMAFERVNAEFMPMAYATTNFSGPNVTIQCKTKAVGSPLAYGDDFVFKLDFASGLDNGKAFLFPCDGCGRAPRVRLETLAAVTTGNDWWEFRLSDFAGKPVHTGVPAELVATNRGTAKDGNLAGYCAVGASPVISMEFGNHCNHAQLAIILADQRPALPPLWVTARGQEARRLANELRTELKAARK